MNIPIPSETKKARIRCRLVITDNKKYVRHGQALIIGDDPQRHEEVATANRNKVGVPFQRAESLFAALAVVKSMTVAIRAPKGWEAASTNEDLKSGNATAWIAPFKFKCAEHVWIGGSIHCHDYDEDVFPCVQF